MSKEKQSRSCFTCKNNNVCFVAREIRQVTTEISVNIDGDAAPGKLMQVFEAMGNCCLKYNPIDQQ